jgi:DNA topoisomerase-1
MPLAAAVVETNGATPSRIDGARHMPATRKTANSTQPASAAANPVEDLPPGLRYVSDAKAGCTRRRIGARFVYFDRDGKRIRDPAEIARINALAVPPAYTDVWICADPRGHLQATGRDARGRKQYRYHPRWRETRDANKYDRMQAFGEALPKIRARVARDLGLPAMPRNKLLATVVRLLDTTLIRIGSAEYARDNRSYGLTTLCKKHLEVKAGQVRFRFRGKSGIEHDVEIDDPRVARIVRRCMDLPGQELFQYVDDDGERRAIDSADINEYLREASEADFTAKDYRTWAASVYALRALRQHTLTTAAESRRHLLATIKEVAALLRNTPAVCRRCYIHPAVIDAFEAAELGEIRLPQRRRGLRVDESAFAALLAQNARRARRAAKATPAKKAGRRSVERANGAAQEQNEDAQRVVKLLAKSRRLRVKAAVEGGRRHAA